MASTSKETERFISRCLSRSMYLIGKSAFVSHLSKNMTQTSDAIFRVRIGRRQFSGGSMSEGTTTATSDYDRMVEEENIIVLTADKPTMLDPDTAYFLADTSKSNVGYTRLKPNGDINMHHKVYGNFETMLERTADGTFLSNDKFVDFIKAMSPAAEGNPFSSYRHGPCITVDHVNIHGYELMKSPTDVTEADVAFAILCDIWPEGSSEWIERSRNADWLSDETIRHIQTLPCHLVPVGDPTTKNTSLEWRFSFLPAEQTLVWSWNDVQIQCYVILKHLRKKYLDPTGTEQLSSFHMKTIVFWVSEESDISDWNEDNLIGCIINCLVYLKKCIQSKNLPNFFMTKNNLFRHKLQSESGRQQICDTISTLLKNKIECVLDGGIPHTCKISSVWTKARRNLDIFAKLCSRDVEIGDLFALCKKVNDKQKLCEAMFNSCFHIANARDPLVMIEKISQGFCNLLPGDADQEFNRHVEYFLDIRIGMLLNQEIRNSIETRRKCEEKFTTGTNLNQLTGNLYLAGFYLCRKMYDECELLLNELLDTPRYYMYTGQCSNKPGITIGITKGLIELTPDVPITGEPDEEIYTAFDLIFTEFDDDFVPYPMKFECALFPGYGESAFVMHPVVFAFTLLYFIHFFRKNEQAQRYVLKGFENIVVQLGFTYQRYRALNIIGFCHSLSGNIGEALMCYIQSLQDTRLKPAVTNAAAYHIAVLSLGVYTHTKTSI